MIPKNAKNGKLQKSKIQTKATQKSTEEEYNDLFGEALLAVKKKTLANAKDGAMETKGQNANDDNTKNNKCTSRAMKMMYQMDANELAAKLQEDPNYVPLLEDEIDFQYWQKGQQLNVSGKKDTSVMEETFKAWQEK
eukprot:15104074-Ditylum_brightwellii.AAC.1